MNGRVGQNGRLLGWQAGHAQLAQCITIEDALKAGVVYIAFSDERWTKKVRDAYASNFMGCRDKRMQKFDAAAWFNGSTQQPHADSVTHVADLLCEYKGSPPDALTTACFTYHDRAGQAPDLKRAMDAITPDKGLLFALWDPAGITQELNFEQQAAFGAVLVPYGHGIWTASAIDSMQKSIIASAKDDVERSSRMLESNAYQALGATALFDGGKLLEKQLQSVEKIKKANLVTAGPEAWKPYTTHYRQQAIVDFKQQMAIAMQQEQARTLVPLSQDHQAGLTSPALLNIFEFDYEQGNCRSGIGYTNLLVSCIEGAADRKEIVDVLVKWANGDVTDTRNPLLRSFVLNHSVLADKVKEAASYNYGDPLREFVAKLIEAYSKVTEVAKHADHGIARTLSGSFARLLQETGGPIVDVVAKNVDAAAAKVIYAAMCMRTGKAFECKPVYGSPTQWVSYIARQMQVMLPGRQQADIQDLQKGLLEKAAPAGAKDLEVKAKQFGPVETLPDEAAAMASIKVGPGTSAKMAAATLTPEVVEKIYMPKFRLFARGEPAFAGIGAIFSAINLRLASEALTKTNRFNDTESRVKFGNACAGLVVSVAQYSSATVEQLEQGGIKLSERLLTLGERAEFIGRYGGPVVGLVAAAIDGYHAWNDFKEGNFVMFALDAASASIGVTLAYVTMFLSASGAAVVALPLMLLAAVVGVLMSYFDEREAYGWLERCYFGLKEASKRFPNLAEDQKAFEALAL